MDLTPAQREKIQLLLEEELRSAIAGRDGTAAGETLADRRRALERLIAVHDAENLLGQDGEGGRVGEDR
jgi:hypothetical protein